MPIKLEFSQKNTFSINLKDGRNVNEMMCVCYCVCERERDRNWHEIKRKIAKNRD